MFGSPIEMLYIAFLCGIGFRIGSKVIDVAMHTIKHYAEK